MNKTEWKSHNYVAVLEAAALPQRRMAALYAELIGVIVQYWIPLTVAWSDVQRSLRKACGHYLENGLALGESSSPWHSAADVR